MVHFAIFTSLMAASAVGFAWIGELKKYHPFILPERGGPPALSRRMAAFLWIGMWAAAVLYMGWIISGSLQEILSGAQSSGESDSTWMKMFQFFFGLLFVYTVFEKSTAFWKHRIESELIGLHREDIESLVKTFSGKRAEEMRIMYQRERLLPCERCLQYLAILKMAKSGDPEAKKAISHMYPCGAGLSLLSFFGFAQPAHLEI